MDTHDRLEACRWPLSAASETLQQTEMDTHMTQPQSTSFWTIPFPATIRIESPNRQTPIQRMAAMFLRGAGIEVGALHNPLRVPPGVTVRYVDRMRTADLRRHYPELSHLPIVEPDILDDGETLATISPASCNFVIASHFLEHAQNTILTVENFLRVLKPGGVALLAIPDKRFTFDRDRPTTPFDHLLREDREGPACSRQSHFEEWVRLVDKVTEPAAFHAKLKQRLDSDYSIHYHVWTNSGMVEMFSRLQSDLSFPFEIAASLADYGTVQVIFVLQKL
jgi:predicted SAM-dependent methyltransferase